MRWGSRILRLRNSRRKLRCAPAFSLPAFGDCKIHGGNHPPRPLPCVGHFPQPPDMSGAKTCQCRLQGLLKVTLARFRTTHIEWLRKVWCQRHYRHCSPILFFSLSFLQRRCSSRLDGDSKHFYFLFLIALSIVGWALLTS